MARIQPEFVRCAVCSPETDNPYIRVGEDKMSCQVKLALDHEHRRDRPTLTTLIVGDDPMDRKLIKDYLGATGVGIDER